jgi:hypothetical protein
VVFSAPKRTEAPGRVSVFVNMKISTPLLKMRSVVSEDGRWGSLLFKTGRALSSVFQGHRPVFESGKKTSSR